MNTQPETYPQRYLFVRRPIVETLILLAIVVIAPSLRAQQSGATLDPAAQQLLKEGKQALSANRYDDSEKAFRKANKITHDSCFPCWEGIAHAQEGRGDLEGALKSIEKAMRAAGDDRQRAQAHDLRAEAFLGASNAAPKPDEKKLKQAEAEARTSVQLDGEYPNYHLRLAIVLFKESLDPEGKSEAQRYLDLAPDGPDSAWAKSVIQDPRRARDKFAPEFEVTTASGDKLALASLSGKLVVLDFWATWCPPCRDSIGDLRELTKKYSKDRVVLISVSADADQRAWSSFIAEKKMVWAQYLDESGSMRRLFSVHAFPTYIVIDGDGVIRERIVGENPQQSVVRRLKETLQTLTPQKGS